MGIPDGDPSAQVGNQGPIDEAVMRVAQGAGHVVGGAELTADGGHTVVRVARDVGHVIGNVARDVRSGFGPMVEPLTHKRELHYFASMKDQILGR